MPFKILHVASFIGNIGDNASHIGLYNILSNILNKDYCIHKIEIRKFYNNYKGNDKIHFDKFFIDFANSFDLLLIGGGGFLDYWVPHSKTGTTLNFDVNDLNKLRVPMLIASVGCFPHRHIPNGNIERFKRFLDYSLDNDNITIAFRNDGSTANLTKLFGKKYSNNFTEILDNGFFYVPENNNTFPLDKNYIAINISDDQIDMISNLNGKIDKDLFYDQIKVFIEKIVQEKQIDIVIIPHIHSDLKAISKLIEKLDDYLLRSNVSVAPCVQKDIGANYCFSIYNNSSLVIGTRLHANVCAISMGKKCIGIAVLDRIKFLYDNLNMNNSYVLPDKYLNFELFQKAINSLSKTIDLNENRITLLKIRSMQFYKKYFSVLIR